MNKISKGKRFIVLTSLIVLIVVVGTTGFIFIEGYTFLDALYMTIITVSTIGTDGYNSHIQCVKKSVTLNKYKAGCTDNNYQYD